MLLWGILAATAFPHTAQASPFGWQPENKKIWVFVVGLVKFEHNDVFDNFPTKNRRDADLVRLFKTRGVPATNIVYLQDKQAKQAAIGPALINLLKKTKAGDTLFLYYEGHGYREENGDKAGFFAAYDTDDDEISGWPIDSICPTINKYFKGNRAFLTADCCYSGYLAQTVKKQRGKIAYACMASSSAREQSTGNWTFTECLLDGLNGLPYVDLNGNGSITIGELADHARTEMAMAEEQHATFTSSNDFPPDALITKARPKEKAPLGQRVKVKYGDEWLTGRVIAVKSGEYQVKCIGYDDPADWFDIDDTSQMRQIRPAKTYKVGSRVEVKWEGDWYAAKVLKVEGGVHFIHYIEDDSSWDEWVSSRRIRLLKN